MKDIQNMTIKELVHEMQMLRDLMAGREYSKYVAQVTPLLKEYNKKKQVKAEEIARKFGKRVRTFPQIRIDQIGQLKI